MTADSPKRACTPKTAYALGNVSFTYGGPWTLAVPDLEIPAGKVTAFVGPNGSGKTTLLHLLAFLASPRKGEIRFFGETPSAKRLRPLRLRASLLLQSPYLFDTTVFRNVAWGLKLRGVPAEARERKVRSALEQVGLSRYEHHPAAALSGGEAQRLALARLLALDTEVLLLDEPTSHLDRESRTRIEETLMERVRDRSTTVVLSTHDLSSAYRLEARVWRLEAGRLIEGDPENLFRGRAVPDEPGIFDTGKVRLVVQPLPGDARCVRVSPREVVLSREPFTSSARNNLQGTVVRAERVHGDEVYVTLDCGEPIVAVVTPYSWEKLGFTIGTAAVASFKASSIVVC